MLLNCKGRLLDIQRPVVMGILNVTPDSFHDGGRHNAPEAALRRAEQMLQEGATLLDVGGVSTRPGAADVTESEELARVIPVIELISKELPEVFVSVDTWRASVAKAAVAAGAVVVNDVSGGQFDPQMFPTVAQLGVSYILMHIQGQPQTMQQAPVYADVVQEVLDFLVQKIHALRALGVVDVVLDPGFGFGKTVEHNYALLRNLHVFEQVTGLPVLAGVSRKSMICKVLGVKPADALNGTTALHVVALQQGARILRVHDVREAVEVVRIFEYGIRNAE
jgi:dihydropteroate synthase